jgi:hypothetical protein
MRKKNELRPHGNRNRGGGQRARQDLVSHGHDEAAVTGAASRDAVHPPPRAEGDLGAHDGGVNAEVHLPHLERDERGRVEAAVDVGLVAGHVGAVYGARVDDDGVRHGRGGQQRVPLARRQGVPPVHGGVRARRGPAVGHDEALGELEAVLHRAREGLLHGPGRRSGRGVEAGRGEDGDGEGKRSDWEWREVRCWLLAWFKREMMMGWMRMLWWWAVSPPEVSGAGFTSLCLRGRGREDAGLSLHFLYDYEQPRSPSNNSTRTK